MREAVSFSERFERLDVGLLDWDAAVDVIRTPMSERGLALDEGVIESVVEDAQCYPFFLQLWGKALWDAAHNVAEKNAEGALTINRDVRNEAFHAVDRDRRDFYSYRYKDIRRDNLFWAAVAVSRKFIETSVDGRFAALPDSVVDNAVSPTVPDVDDPKAKSEVVGQVSDALEKHGFIWKSKSQGGRYLPGIPSLMAYVLSEPAFPDGTESFAELYEWLSEHQASQQQSV